MPTYEYRCTQCGHRFDVFQRIDEEPLQACERCGGELRKVFHPAGIVFKGSGFYATDSRRSAKTGGESGSGSTDAGGEKKTTSGEQQDKKPSSDPAGKKPSEPKKAAT